MWHIIERFAFHFVASTVLTIAVFFALRYWGMHNSKVGTFISGRKAHLVVISALLVFALLPLREPYDIIRGTQIWYKTIFDQASWFIGCAMSAWGLYRFAKLEN